MPQTRLILFFVGIICLHTAFSQDADIKWLHSNNPLDIPLEIHVSLLGKTNIRADDLRILLAAHLPNYRVSDIESHQMSQVQFALTYQVDQSTEEKTREYERQLSAAILQSERSATDGLIYVNTDPLVAFFGRMHVESMRTVKREDQFYSVFVVAPDHSRLGLANKGEKDRGYVYSTGHGRRAGSGIWIGPGRWIVVDLSAAPVEYGSSEGQSAFTSSSLPYYDPAHPDLQTTLAPAETQLAVLVTNAVKNVFASDVKFHLIRDETRIIVPIILLRNHDMFDPFKEPGHEYSIDVELIKQEISPMLLPSQRLDIVTASHSLHEHKPISMAVFKSLKTVSNFVKGENGLYSVFKTTHVDSSILEYEFKRAGDVLFSGLLKDKSESKANYGVPRTGGPRIIPVYVVSLVGIQDGLTLEGSNLYRASENVVIALQTNDTQVSVPYFYKQRPLTANGVRINRHIIAGLVQALGAVSDPTTHFSVVHQSARTDYSFAFGYHPFGHFSASEQVSKIFADAVIRNHIISRVDFTVNTLRGVLADVNSFAKDYMYNPLGESVKYVGDAKETDSGLSTWTDQLFAKAPSKSKLRATLGRLKEDTKKMASQIQIVSHLLAEHEFDKAYEISKGFKQSSVNLKEYVKSELASVEMDLACCYLSVDSEGRPTTSWISTIFVLGGLASLALVVLWIILPRFDSIQDWIARLQEKLAARNSRGNSSLL